MADELGKAVLKIEVDDAAAKTSLENLRKEIDAVNKSAKAAGRTGGGSRSGGARESVRALEQAQERRFRLSQQINRLEQQGVNVSRLRASLGRLTDAQSTRQFELQRRQSVELSRQIRLSQARLRTERETAAAVERQQSAAQRAGGPRSPLRGAVDIPGSPAFLAAQRRFESSALSRSASIGGPRSPIGGSTTIPGSPAFLDAARKAGEVQARAFQQEIARAARQGGARSPLRGAVDIPGSPAFNLNQLREQRRRADELRRAEERNRRQEIRNATSSPVRGGTSFPGSPAFLESERRQEARRLRAERAALERSARQGGPSSPLGGRANIPGSPAARLAARRSNEGAISSGLIGFGFPLLFGQGIGASIGGGAGGLAGGKLGGGFGFGLSVLGTAVGAQFDAIIAKATALGKALDSPITNFGAVQENALLSSKGLEKHVASLIASGREAEAAALIQKDLAASYGGAEAAANLAKEQDRLNRSYTQLTVGLASLGLGPLADSAQGAADALLGLKALLDGISNFVPPQIREKVEKAQGNLALRAFGAATGTNAAFDILGFLGQFAPRRREGANAGGAIPPPDAADERQRARLLSEQYRLVDAQAQGYEDLAKQSEIRLSTERELADIARLRASGAGAPQIEERRQQGALERYRLQQELKQLQDKAFIDRATKDAAQRLQLEAVQRQSANATELLGTSGPRQREQLQLRQQALEAANASRDRERVLGAQIDAIRQKDPAGGDKQIADLVKQQNEAAETTRLKLIEGADALVQAGKQLNKDLTEATLQLVDIRSSDTGLNQFLNSDQIRARAAKDFELLKPQFERAKKQFTELTGAAIPDRVQFLSDVTAFAGANTDTNKAITDFIKAVNDESTAVDNLADVQKALNANVADLAEVSAQLVKSTLDLAAKSWAVNVTVNADGTSTAYGDVVNRAI